MDDGRDPSTFELLRNVDFLVSFDDSQLAELASSARYAEVAAGDWVFRAGDPGDELMIVMRGRLEVHVPGAPEGASPGALGPGDVVGELAVFTATTRSASIRARRDATLLVLERAAVTNVLENNPSTAVGIAGWLAARVQRSVGINTSSRTDDVLALIGWSEGLHLERIAEVVAAEIGGTAVRVPPVADAARFAEHLAAAERWNEHVVLVAQCEDNEWYRFCLRSADRVVLIVGNDDVPPTAESIDPNLRGSAVAFVERRPATRSHNALWIDALNAAAWYQLGALNCLEQGSAKMGRRLAGLAIGVVLSGGGARGFAHIGALQGLAEVGVVVDRVGGCSMGALVAALHASGFTPPLMVSRLRSTFTRRWALRQLTISRQSLLRSDRLDHLLAEFFGDELFEQLPSSCYAVSADLVTAELVEHQRGGVAAAVRASMAIPGLLAPVKSGERLLVDGGLLDNLPVASMARGEGPIVAVDVMRDHPERRGHEPGILEVLAEAAMIGRRPTISRGRKLATVLIAPPVSDVGLLDFHRIDEVVDVGRRAALRAAENGELDALST